MIKDILLEVGPSQTRLALLEDGDVAELYIERAGSERGTGNILLGRVANVLPGMQAAFVDIGQPKNGFLFAGDIRIDPSEFGPEADALGDQLRRLPIQKLVKSGQEILAQVIKEPGGDKGPRITNHVTLPGRLTVLLPTVNYVGISRRIDDEAERGRLRELAEAARPEGMGLIVRTAAEGAQPEELAHDVEYLKRLWASIVARAAAAKAPALLHRDEGLAHRAVRDMLTDEVRALWVDDKAQFEQLRDAAALISPDLAARVALHDNERPLFALHRVDAALERALSRKVWLKSGGYLVFDYAEALTVIDVNTGKFTGSHSLSDTVFAINCEAAAEIARQIRLRNIGGIIVID
ncbi:MAG: Rne/Rng family ribonuclease, partial [Clostridiales bacterium]|nr:Rne/Rng family ribonuclease [Clostridiales bacterium]